MLEKDIENLIAQYPEDFFPNEGFSLIGQQYSIEGRRIDILFEDSSKRKIIVEVKRGILTREASGQVAEYFGLLKSRNQDSFHEMVLCANVIPKERRLFLEHIGIECKELGIAMIAEIANKRNYTFIDDRSTFSAPEIQPYEISQEIPEIESDEISVWVFQANPQRYDILNSLSDIEIGNSIHWLVNQHRNEIKAGHLGLIWMSGSEAGIYALARVESNPAIMKEFSAERKYWTDSTEGKEAMRVQMTIMRRFTNNPILKRKLVETEGLKRLSILRQFQGTNFPVKNKEWQTISRFM
jgi:EVE domain/Endonuclease NucS